MSSRIVLAASCKGAFRVEVFGTRPDEVTRLMLTGQGDEHEIELAAGPYTASVTNIGTGDRQNFDFRVDDDDRTLHVGGGEIRAGNWRSISEAKGIRKGWKPTGDANSVLGRPSGPTLLSHTSSGWRTFRGGVMVNDDWPTALKIVRSRTWSENPLLRAEFARPNGASIQCFVPLFSGGTLIQWGGDDGRVADIKPCEHKSAAIVGSLTSSVREELPHILQWAAGSDEAEAIHSIMNSRDDPWIAAAAGLLLVGSARLQHSGASLARLAARSPWLADLGVLAAWARAADTPDRESACLDLLVEARRKGTVYFWQTCSIADRLLAALASSKSSEVRLRSRKEHSRWKTLRTDAFKIGAFLAHPASSPASLR